MAQQLLADLLILQDAGLHRISPERLTVLKETYRDYDQPAAREILRWLAGEYQVTDEMVQTQYLPSAPGQLHSGVGRLRNCSIICCRSRFSSRYLGGNGHSWYQ